MDNTVNCPAIYRNRTPWRKTTVGSASGIRIKSNF